jgi:hypothetical protein
MSHYAQLEGFSFFKAKCSLNYLHQNHNGSMAGCRPPGQLNGILVDYGLHQLPSPGGLSMVELRLSMEDWGGGRRLSMAMTSGGLEQNRLYSPVHHAEDPRADLVLHRSPSLLPCLSLATGKCQPHGCSSPASYLPGHHRPHRSVTLLSSSGHGSLGPLSPVTPTGSGQTRLLMAPQASTFHIRFATSPP